MVKKKVTQPAGKKKVGRPSMEFNQKTADRICELIADGKSLRTICKYKLMPSRPTVLKWLREVNAFAVEYARAHEDQAEFYAEELLSLSKQANSENANAIRVRADIIKWICSKLKPRKYADRLGLEVQAEVRMPDQLGMLEAARRIAFVLQRGAERVKETQSGKEPLRLPAPEKEVAAPVVKKPEAPKPEVDPRAPEAVHFGQIISGEITQSDAEREENLQAAIIESECRKQRGQAHQQSFVPRTSRRWQR